MLILINCPGTALNDYQWNMVIDFVNSGGTLVFVGNSAVFYDGLAVTPLMPAVFDTTRVKEHGGRRGRLPQLDDKTEYVPVASSVQQDDLNVGLDYANSPKVSLYRTAARDRAAVHLRAGEFPLLTSWAVGKGTVYCFPAAVTDRIDWSGHGQENTISEEDRRALIFWWDSYDELWQRIYARALGASLTIVDRCVVQRESDALTCNIHVRDIPAVLERITVSLRMTHVGGNTRQTSSSFECKARQAAGSLAIDDVPSYRNVEYVVTISDLSGRALGRKTGRSKGAMPAPFSLTLGEYGGLVNVYKQGIAMPGMLTAGGAQASDASLAVDLALFDPWDELVWEKHIRFAGADLEFSVPTMSLADGRYLLKARSDSCTDSSIAYILRERAAEDAFPIIMYSNPSSLQDDPYDWKTGWDLFEQGGFNSYIVRGGSSFGGAPDMNRGWIERNMRRMADYAQRRGIGLNLHFQQILGGWEVGHFTESNHSAHEKQITDKYRVYANAYSMAPYMGLTYIFDEPYHNNPHRLDCRLCADRFAETSGRKAPAPHEQHQDAHAFRAMSDTYMIDKLKFGRDVLARIDEQGLIRTWGANNCGSVRAETSHELAKYTHLYTSDNYAWRWGYDLSAEATLAAKGRGGNLGFMNFAAAFSGACVDPDEHRRYAYAALARGTRMFAWFTWYAMNYGDAIEFHPQRFAVISRINHELKRIGPVLNQYMRAKGKIAMLVPCSASGVIHGVARREIEALAKGLLARLQPKCGNLDYLFPQHIAGGRLNEYGTMVIAGERLLSDGNWRTLETWIEDGGTLVLFDKAISLSTRQEPSSIYAEVCPAEGVKHVGKGRILHFAELPSAASAMAALLEKHNIDGFVASSSADQVSPYLFSGTKNTGHCVVLVNTEATPVRTEIALNLSGAYAAYDLASGRLVVCRADTIGRTSMAVELDRFGGAAFLLLPKPVGGVHMDVPTDGERGSRLVCTARLLDAEGEAMEQAAPVDLEVTDPLGTVRKEYSGYRVLKRGCLALNIDLARNEPIGRWQVKGVCPLGGQEIVRSFVVQ